MNIITIIEKKSKGINLENEEIRFIIEKYIAGEVPDYQISAFLMAIKLKGMTDSEIIELTKVYIENSYVFETKEDIYFDKHSTGGVGDKVSIALVPLLGSLGMKSLKFSGRGLGFTGGTLDKLESLKGFKVELDNNEIQKILDTVGITIVSTTDNIVPADKKIYALRDVTATVNSLPLIAASIMSKKIVSGSKHILIDLKVGTGAFMENMDDASELARLMKIIGEAFDRKVFIAFTTMSQPLGKMIGNGCEIKEAIEILNGKGPEDAHNLIVKLASEIYSSLMEIEYKEAEEKVLNSMNDGSAYKKFLEWIEAQGADMDYFNQEKYFDPKFVTSIKAKNEGYISFKSSAEFGKIAIELKAGRKVKTDKLNLDNGIHLLVKHGDFVNQYDEIIELFSDKELSTEFLERVYSNIIISKEKPEEVKLVLKEIKW